MNRFVTIGLGAAAVVVAILVGAQLLRPSSDGNGIGNQPSPSATPVPTPESTPSPSAEANQPEPFVVTGDAAHVQVTVLATRGWSSLAGLDAVTKNDDGLDPPQSVGAALLAWSWPVGTGFDVYGDPCQWTTTIPDTPATTPDAIAAALAAQAESDPTDPVDVTVGGYAGKAITLHVPMTYDVPNATREERFAACDAATYGFYGIDGGSETTRNAQGAGQVDELWILDVEGRIVILDATYSPATPDELVDEMRAMVESATFEVP
jgi:hypothetical protein